MAPLTAGGCTDVKGGPGCIDVKVAAAVLLALVTASACTGITGAAAVSLAPVTQKGAFIGAASIIFASLPGVDVELEITHTFLITNHNHEFMQ
jgi:uncharacterized protein (DUF58 family)